MRIEKPIDATSTYVEQAEVVVLGAGLDVDREPDGVARLSIKSSIAPDVTVGASGSVTPDFTYSDILTVYATGTPITINAPTGMQEGRSAFLRLIVGVSNLMVSWSSVYWFPGGDGSFSKTSGNVDWATFIIPQGATEIHGVIAKEFGPTSGPQ